MKDFELDKYSNGLVSNRKSLIRSNYKMSSLCNSSEKRYNVPVPGSNPNPNNNNKDNDNGNLNTLSHMKLPEQRNFTISTISLIVNVPSLSYVSEYIDDDDDDDEDLTDNLMYKLDLNNQQNQICPICNTICIELKQQFDDLQLKRSFSLSSIHDTTYNDTTNTTTTNNNNNSNITRPRLWDILESFTMNSSNKFCQFHKYLSVYYNKIVSITRNTTNTTTNNNNCSSSSSNNNMGSNLTNSLSLPCLSNINEELMISTIYNENDILHSNNNDVIYNRKT
ncbi:unnamed protein product, partial [Schistosoma rodhaini]